MDKGVPHARERAAAAAGRARPGVAWRGVAWRGEARRGRQAGSRVTLLLQLPTHGVTRLELADSWRDSATFLLQLPSARG